MKKLLALCLLFVASIASSTVTTISAPGIYQGQTYTDKVIVRCSNCTFKNNKVSTISGPCVQVGAGTPGAVNNVVVDSNAIGPCGSRSLAIGDHGISANGTMDVTISNNTIHDVSDGIYIVNSYHGYTIKGNTIWNVRGPFYDGVAIAIGLLDKPGLSPTHQTSILCNVIDDRLGNNSVVNDHINIGESNLGSGSSSVNSEFVIAYNKIRGALTTSTDPTARGHQMTGSGIQTQDAKNYQNLWVHDNIIVEVNGCGMCVAGTNVLVTNNIVENNGQSASSLTYMAYAFGGNGASCTNLTAYGNRGIAKLWDWGFVPAGANSYSAGYEPGGAHANTLSLCTGYVGDNANNFNDTTLTPDVWNTPIPQCGKVSSPPVKRSW